MIILFNSVRCTVKRRHLPHISIYFVYCISLTSRHVGLSVRVVAVWALLLRTGAGVLGGTPPPALPELWSAPPPPLLSVTKSLFTMVNKTAENISTAQCTLNIWWESISHFKLSCGKKYSSYYLNYEVINTLFKDEVGKFKVQ